MNFNGKLTWEAGKWLLIIFKPLIFKINQCQQATKCSPDSPLLFLGISGIKYYVGFCIIQCLFSSPARSSAVVVAQMFFSPNSFLISAKSCFSVGKMSLYWLAKMLLLSSGKAIFTISLFLLAQRRIPTVGFSSGSFS